MSQIRETIECLCNIMVYHGTRKTTAEAFRQAKFDKPEATESMWLVLFSLNLLEDKHFAKKEEKHVASVAECEPERTVRLCKHKLFRKGYRSVGFYSLPEDMSFGSRQILLAVGWLVASEKVIDKLIGQARSLLTEDLTMLIASDCLSADLDTLQFPRSQQSDGWKNFQHNLNYLAWLNGRLIAAQRKVLAVMYEYALLLSKTHKAIYPPSSAASQLSLQEVYLLRHESQLEKFQTLLESKNSYFQSLLVWKRNEDIFWKWMGSVLDSNVDNLLEPNENEIECLSNAVHKPRDSLQKAKEQQVELSKLLQHHEQSYKKITKSWKKIKASFDSHERLGSVSECHKEGFEMDQYQIEKEVFTTMQTKFLYTDLEEVTTHERNFGFGGRIKLLNNKVSKQQSEEKLSRMSSSSFEIEKLSAKTRTFQEQLDCLRRTRQEDMLALSEKLNEVVCIPVGNIL